MIESITLADATATAVRTRSVLIVDDHPLVRKGLTLLVDDEVDLQVCGEASDEQSALDAVIRLRPDVVLVDWILGNRDASALIMQVRNICPAAIIVVVSMHDEVDYANSVARLGARGYVMKRDAPDRIIEGIRRALNGLHAYSERALNALAVDLKAGVEERQRVALDGVAPTVSPGDKADLVIAPHPDDETFGCGGTIRLVSESGIAVDVVFMTRGELGDHQGSGSDLERQKHLAAERTMEATGACLALGVRRISFLTGGDTRLAQQPNLSGELLSVLNQQCYRRIFCPWKGDAHVDHQATFGILQEALGRYAKPVQVWLYEVWTPLAFNVVIPIDRTIGHKKKAMQMYKTQIHQLNYRGGFLGLSAYRSTFCPPATYAEAFFMCAKEEFLSM
jgi:LmbE family N-acetylglucosaminyl deacetylase/DNA-binding NarL/FixJ family response regulator